MDDAENEVKPSRVDIEQIELKSSISSIHLPKCQSPDFHSRKKTSCKSKVLTFLVMLLIFTFCIVDVSFHCFIDAVRSHSLSWPSYLSIVLVALALWSFVKAVFASPEAFSDQEFIIAESLFEEMLENEILNTKSEAKKLELRQKKRILDTDQLLIRILQHSKHFNSKISKIRSMIDGYRRPGPEAVPV